MHLNEIKNLSAKNTILFLGAGASIPSGGMSANQLAEQLLEKFSVPTHGSLSLIEACSYIESIQGRRELVEFIKEKLISLKPSAGMLAIPNLDWKEIYTTNFDTLIEQAYNYAGQPLSVMRSDFDFSNNALNLDTPFYKIHGCITTDRGFGYKTSMTLTQTDYENYEQYRHMVYKKMELSLITNNVLVIGHSLSDPHLRESIKQINQIKRDIASNKNIYVVVFEEDPIRMSLIRNMGCVCICSSLDIVINNLMSLESNVTDISSDSSFIPPRLLPTVRMVPNLVVSNNKTNASNLFNGKPADYDDILSGHTFERDIENQILTELVSNQKRFVIVSGTNGVGKTTVCRRICYRITQKTNDINHVWEHITDLPLLVDQWLLVDSKLRGKNENGVLFIDNIQDFAYELRELSKFLPDNEEQIGLKILGAADHYNWGLVTKTRRIFSQGLDLKLSKLSTGDVSRLIDLTESNKDIRRLVDDSFKLLSRPKRTDTLHIRCKRDMYVCLKNIFSNDGIDMIVLQEYDALSKDLQEIYRYISALETAGCIVHRQMVIRIMDLSAMDISKILEQLDGIVFEYGVTERKSEGIFRWATRHEVISRTIAKYKFADQERLFAMLDNVINNINPSVIIELRTIRLLCTSNFGITAIRNIEKRIELYEKLTEIAPEERLPWHRYISTLLDDLRLNDAARVISRTEELFKGDTAIRRRSIQLQILKAQTLTDLPAEDRLALLIQAVDEAKQLAINRSENKFVFETLLDAEFALAEKTKNYTGIDAALNATHQAYDELLDPWLISCLQRYERRRLQISNS